MKQISYIILILAAITSCSDYTESPGESDQKVTLSFSLNSEEMHISRADNKIGDLKVIVFDADGHVRETTTPTRNGNSYKMQVSASPDPSDLHFISGFDVSEIKSLDDLETARTSNPYRQVYWQHINLEKIDKNTKIDETIYMVMNVASIYIYSSTNIEIQDFWICNCTTEGCIAPYNKENSNFADYIYPNGGYDNLISQRYTGNIPENVEYEIKHKDPINKVDLNKNIYVFENSTAKPTYFIMKIRDKFYKLMLAGNSEHGMIKNYHLLRNFRYQLDINSVPSEDGIGKDSFQEAVRGAAANLKFSLEVKDLSKIATDKEKLEVNFINKVLVDRDGDVFKFRYTPDIANPNIFSKDVTFSSPYNSIFKADKLKEYVEGPDNYGWYSVKIVPFKKPTVNDVKQTLYISGKELSIEVNFTYKTPYEMSKLEATPVPLCSDYPMTLSWDMPKKLPKTIFPLKFYIHQSNKTLSPDSQYSEMTVDIDHNGEKDFCFVRNYSYEEYQKDGGSHVECHFITTTPKNKGLVSVENEYFGGRHECMIENGEVETVIPNLPIEVINMPEGIKISKFEFRKKPDKKWRTAQIDENGRMVSEVISSELGYKTVIEGRLTLDNNFKTKKSFTIHDIIDSCRIQFHYGLKLKKQNNKVYCGGKPMKGSQIAYINNIYGFIDSEGLKEVTWLNITDKESLITVSIRNTALHNWWFNFSYKYSYLSQGGIINLPGVYDLKTQNWNVYYQGRPVYGKIKTDIKWKNNENYICCQNYNSATYSNGYIDKNGLTLPTKICGKNENDIAYLYFYINGQWLPYTKTIKELMTPGCRIDIPDNNINLSTFVVKKSDPYQCRAYYQVGYYNEYNRPVYEYIPLIAGKQNNYFDYIDRDYNGLNPEGRHMTALIEMAIIRNEQIQITDSYNQYGYLDCYGFLSDMRFHSDKIYSLSEKVTIIIMVPAPAGSKRMKATTTLGELYEGNFALYFQAL